MIRMEKEELRVEVKKEIEGIYEIHDSNENDSKRDPLIFEDCLKTVIKFPFMR
jgi:hypothetical protein